MCGGRVSSELHVLKLNIACRVLFPRMMLVLLQKMASLSFCRTKQLSTLHLKHYGIAVDVTLWSFQDNE